MLASRQYRSGFVTTLIGGNGYAIDYEREVSFLPAFVPFGRSGFNHRWLPESEKTNVGFHASKTGVERPQPRHRRAG